MPGQNTAIVLSAVPSAQNPEIPSGRIAESINHGPDDVNIEWRQRKIWPEGRIICMVLGRDTSRPEQEAGEAMRRSVRTANARSMSPYAPVGSTTQPRTTRSKPSTTSSTSITHRSAATPSSCSTSRPTSAALSTRTMPEGSGSWGTDFGYLRRQLSLGGLKPSRGGSPLRGPSRQRGAAPTGDRWGQSL